MVDQKMIAGIFNDFLGVYIGKVNLGIRPLQEKYGKHPVLMKLLSNVEAASEIPVAKAMKEIYGFYKEYRGRPLSDKDWEEIVERAGQLHKAWNENVWCRQVILEMVNLLDVDDREQRKLAAETEKRLENPPEAAEGEAARMLEWREGGFPPAGMQKGNRV